MQAILSRAASLNHISENLYFQRLPHVSPTTFIQSQSAFINAIDQWSRLLILLLAKMPSARERLPIIANLWDEHGKGDLEEGHIRTFEKCLQSLNQNISLTLYDPDIPTFKIVERFYIEIERRLTYYPWIYGAAMMGMIEYTYQDVSAQIHQYLLKHLEEDRIFHYSLHEIIDEKHAEDLFQTVIPYLDENVQNRALVSMGQEAGYELIYELYQSLSVYLVPMITSE